jgi:hypothetical protein
MSAQEPDDRAQRLRWLALILPLSRDRSAYRDQFRAVVLELPEEAPS